MTIKYLRIPGVALLTVGLAWLGSAGCGSTQGDTGDDGGIDSTTAFDVAQPGPDANDATMPGNDAKSIFGDDSGDDSSGDAVSGDDAPGGDGAGDDGSGDDADDASDSEGGKSDDAAEESGTKDSGPAVDAGCQVVTVPSTTTGFMACAAPVSGTCGPGSLATFTATAPPPTGAKQGLCTTQQTASIYAGCLDPTTGSDAACTTAGNAASACYGCIFTAQTAMNWGPVVNTTSGLSEMNVGGCLALLEPCNSGCANTFEEDLECEQAACAANCPTTSSTTGFENCTQAIDDCTPGCAKYSVGEGCQQFISGSNHPGAVCFANATDFQAQFTAIVPVFCGN
jgi:hypothetical protein